MLKIRLDQFDATNVGKVLKFKDYLSIVEVHDLIASAKKEYANIIKLANAEHDKIVDAAKGEAAGIVKEAKITYESEKEQGYKDGVVTGKAEMANQLMELTTKSAESFTKLEKDIIDIVIRAIKKIIGDIDENELIVSVVKNALKMIKNQKQAVLKVAPSQASFLRGCVEKLTKDTPVIEFLEIVSDVRLSPGSCLIGTELGSVEASIDVQIAAIEKSLRKKNDGQR